MNLNEEIIDFVKHELWEPKKGLSLDTSLLDDIRIDGDDAVEFFEKYSKRFKVDLSGIRWNLHFGPEGFNPFAIFTKSFWRKLLPVTINDLIVSAKNGKWTFHYNENQ
jgi:hypothetical protein